MAWRVVTYSSVTLFTLDSSRSVSAAHKSSSLKRRERGLTGGVEWGSQRSQLRRSEQIQLRDNKVKQSCETFNTWMWGWGWEKQGQDFTGQNNNSKAQLLILFTNHLNTLLVQIRFCFFVCLLIFEAQCLSKSHRSSPIFILITHCPNDYTITFMIIYGAVH